MILSIICIVASLFILFFLIRLPEKRKEEIEKNAFNKKLVESKVKKEEIPFLEVENVRSIGGSNYDEFLDVSASKDGGWYVLGSFSSDDGDTLDIGNGLVILKYDNAGKIANSIKTELGLKSIFSTDDGNFVACGSIHTNDFDGIIVKYDNTGKIEWQKNFGGKYIENPEGFKTPGNGNDSFNSVIETREGSYIVVGASNSVNGDMTGIAKNNGEIQEGAFDSRIAQDAIILKLNNEGNIEWKGSFGGKWDDVFTSVAETNDGCYIAVGYSSSHDGDMTNISKTEETGYIVDDAIIVKYDKDGKIKWKKTFGGSKDDRFYCIKPINDGGCIVVGESNSLDGDMKGLGKDNLGEDFNAIIVRYDKDGNILFKQSFGGSKDDVFNSVTVTSDDNFIAVGKSSSFDGDMDGAKKGNVNGVVVMYNNEGKILYKNSFGGNYQYNGINTSVISGSGETEFASVDITQDNKLVIVGSSFANTCDMSGRHKGARDAVLLVYKQNKR